MDPHLPSTKNPVLLVYIPYIRILWVLDQAYESVATIVVPSNGNAEFLGKFLGFAKGGPPQMMDVWWRDHILNAIIETLSTKYYKPFLVTVNHCEFNKIMCLA